MCSGPNAARATKRIAHKSTATSAAASPSREAENSAARTRTRPMTSSTLRSSLSLPEIKMVERRVIAYKQGWDKRIEHVEKGLQMEEHLARRRLRDSIGA